MAWFGLKICALSFKKWLNSPQTHSIAQCMAPPACIYITECTCNWKIRHSLRAPSSFNYLLKLSSHVFKVNQAIAIKTRIPAFQVCVAMIDLPAAGSVKQCILKCRSCLHSQSEAPSCKRAWFKTLAFSLENQQKNHVFLHKWITSEHCRASMYSALAGSHINLNHPLKRIYVITW